MSIRAFTWAFDEVTGVNRGEKLVLLALAEFANDDDITWRARHEIARRALCSDRSLTDYLTSLEAKGFIEREPRYRWCDSGEGACEGRPSHKHRCGTTYRVRRDRKNPVNIPPLSTSAKSAGVAKKSVNAGSATNAKSAGVKPHPQNSGVHTSKILRPYDSYNRQLNYPNPPTPQVAPGRVEAGLVGKKFETNARLQQSCAAGEASAQPGEPDWDLIRDCLPADLRKLSTSAAIKATSLLSERLGNGWSRQELQRFIGQDPLPDTVKNLSGLVCWRIKNTPAVPPERLTVKPQVALPLEEESASEAEPVTVEVAREVAWFFTPAALGINKSAVGNEKHWRKRANKILAASGGVFDRAIQAGESVSQSLRKAVQAGVSHE